MTVTLYEVRKYIDHGQLEKSGNQPFNFPGGEAHIAFSPSRNEQLAFVQGGSGDDLMQLAMWADAAKRWGCDTTAVIPYLPGARMDRGKPLGAKVYADIINSMGIDRLVCLDPHSDVAPALYENMTVVSVSDLMFWKANIGRWHGVIAPDAGAVKRAGQVASKLNLPVYQASKRRDFATGKLSGFDCEKLPTNHSFLIVDDICDGGGTFNGLADHLRKEQNIVTLSLWVTHGIFSQGLDELIRRFNWIGTTNSHSGSDRFLPNNVDKIDILNFLTRSVLKGF